jgi:internalin A
MEENFSRQILRRLKKLRRLYAFSLDYIEVTGAFLDSFESLARLQHFSCSESPFNDRGLTNLTRARRMIKLQLENTLVTDQGLRQLAKLKNLTEYYVSGSRITEPVSVYPGSSE